MPREITLTEIICVRQMADLMNKLVDGDGLTTAVLSDYEFEVGLLIETARPELFAVAKSPNPEPLTAPRSPGAEAAIERLLGALDLAKRHIEHLGALPEDIEKALGEVNRAAFPPKLPETPTATLSPGASGAAASPIPAGGGHLSPCVTGGLLTYEGLHDALVAYQQDTFGGHVQPDAEGWAKQTFDFIIRHAERASDEAALAEVGKAVAA